SGDNFAAQTPRIPPMKGPRPDLPPNTSGGHGRDVNSRPKIPGTSRRGVGNVLAVSDGDGEPARRNCWERAVPRGTGQAVRWLGAFGLVIWQWQAGPPATLDGWLPVLLPAVFLLLPDLGSVELPGLKLEMRRTREEIASLHQQVAQLQLQVAQVGAVGAIF